MEKEFLNLIEIRQQSLEYGNQNSRISPTKEKSWSTIRIENNVHNGLSKNLRKHLLSKFKERQDEQEMLNREQEFENNASSNTKQKVYFWEFNEISKKYQHMLDEWNININ